MRKLYEVREEHGGVFTTVFDDGLIVPWKPLSLGDYIKYSHDKQRNLIPAACLEDEIFKKCVIDKAILRQLPFLKAGIITTVVTNIWMCSGPTGVEAFNSDLEAARNILFSDNTKALHELVQIITVAYPYKPEEVYAMDYETFLFRLAQAEQKLIQWGPLKERINLVQEEQEAPNKQQKPIKQEQDNIRQTAIDAKKLWDAQNQPKKPVRTKFEEIKTQEKWWTKSPVLEAPNRRKIDFNTESAEIITFGMSGHEKADKHIATAKLVEDAKWIYADLIKELYNK